MSGRGGKVGLPIGAVKALDEIAFERARQVTAEGWTLAHDDLHKGGELAAAGACYALFASQSQQLRDLALTMGGHFQPVYWPLSWSAKWFKPKSRREDLIRAAALLVAEIERLDRASPRMVSRG